jgi:hypothetical protein
MYVFIVTQTTTRITPRQLSSGAFACSPPGCRRGISSVEVRKIGFSTTISSLLDFLELFKTEVVIAEVSPLSGPRGIEYYA